MKLITDITSSEYHSITRREDGKLYCSKSGLWKYAEDPFLYKYGPPFKMTPAMKLGSYLDACLLDPEEKTFFYNKNDNPHLSKGRCLSAAAKQWKAGKEKDGLYEISDAEQYQIEQNLAHINQHAEAKKLLHNHNPQTAMFGELLGVPFKGLIDIVPHRDSQYGDGIGDLKRTGKFAPSAFKWHVRNMGYHVQGKAYLDLWNEIQRVTGGTDFRSKFYILASNSEAPHQCGVGEVSQALLNEAGKWLQEWLPKWRWSVETNTWPNPWDGEDGILTLE